jgi:hypothetical protein
LVLFRLYGPDDQVREGDLVSTRTYLHYLGLLEADDFDERLHPTSKPA